MFTILFISPLIVFAIHIILVRIFRSSFSYYTVIKSAILGYFPTGFLLWYFVFYSISSRSELLSAILYSFVLYSSFACMYFQIFIISETARRIRILYEIYKNGSLSRKDIIDLYEAPSIIDSRLKRLVEIKQLKYEDGYYSLSGTMLYWMAWFVSLWRNILGFEKSSKKL